MGNLHVRIERLKENPVYEKEPLNRYGKGALLYSTINLGH